MTDANVKLAQDVYGLFLRGDIPTMLESMTSDVTFGMIGSKDDVPMFSIRNGKSGVQGFFRDLAATQDINDFVPRDFVAGGDKVFVWGHAKWTMCSNGLAGDNEWLHVFGIRDGKVYSWRGYVDTAALSAAYHAPAGGRRAKA